MAASFSIEGAPNSKKLLYDLAKCLNQAYSTYDIEMVLRKLEYSVNTAWGSALAQIIYYASVKGVLVTEALSDLAESLGRSRKIIEHAKRENNESLIMIKYLAPISYLLSIFFALRFFGFSIIKFLRYQFLTPIGMKWFVICSIVFIVGICAEAYLSKEKMDI